MAGTEWTSRPICRKLPGMLGSKRLRMPGRQPVLTIRPATIEDCADISRLVLIAADGLADYGWGQHVRPGETVAEFGARLYAHATSTFSYLNCLVAELDGAVVGVAHCYAKIKDPNDAPAADPVLAPYGELSDYGSFFVLGLAVDEAHRNAGIGSALLEAVYRRARDFYLPRVSLICFGRNEGAVRFYKRQGFREMGRCPVVPHPLLTYQDGDAILFVRDTR
jgi:ribosomal protein S18 acetylase RimI-like enzyme